jgi:CBS domain-containing protein
MGRQAAAVRDVMVATDVVAHPDHGVLEAAARMRDQGLPLLAVADGDTVVGVLSASDILEGDPADDRDTGDVEVQTRMTTDIAFCYDSDDLVTAQQVMRERSHRYLLVIDTDGYLVGVVGDKAVAEALSHVPRHGTARPEASHSRHVDTPGRAVKGAPGQPKFYNMRPKVRR